MTRINPDLLASAKRGMTAEAFFTMHRWTVACEWGRLVHCSSERLADSLTREFPGREIVRRPSELREVLREAQ